MNGCLHLYALVGDRVDELPAGAFAEPLTQIEVGPLVAVAGRAPSPAVVDEAGAVAHARVVEALAARAEALLPSRFGVRFPDERALAAAIVDRRDVLGAALERVRGCAEVAIRVELDEPPAGRPASGRDYLERRARQVRRLQATVSALHDPLAERAREAALEERLAPLRLRASYLVPRADAASFARTARELAALVEGHVAVCGPWPPYSFAGEAA